MTSKIVVNNIEADAGVSTVTFNSNVERGTSNLHSVGLEAAGINVLGADTPIGTGSTIYDDGGARFSGVVTATSFSGGLPITNGGDNRVITASSASALKGEAGLTYNGTRLDVTTGDLQVIGGEGGNAEIRIVADEGDDGADYWRFQSNASSNELNIATYSSGSWVDQVTFRNNGYVNIDGASDVRLTLGSQGTAGTNDSNWIRGNGANLMYNCATTSGDHIWEIGGTAYAKINDEFGMKADNTCKVWLCYRGEAGNEGIQDDFNVSSVNDEGTGSFWVNLDRNIHRHGNGFYQSIVFGCYNDGSRQLIAGIGYAPSHGSYNPWWDVEDNGCRVNTQRSTDGVKVDAKVFSLAMFGDTSDLSPT